MKILSILAGSLVALSLVAVSCSGSGDDAKKASPADTTIKSNAVQGEGFAPTTNIRYIDSDSIMRGYKLADTINGEIARIQQEMARLEQQAQSRMGSLQQNIQQKAQANRYISEQDPEYIKDMKNANSEAQKLQQNLAIAEKRNNMFLATLQQALADSLNNFLVDYNATHHYDAILYKAAGAYFNPSLDITDEVLKGMNKRFTGYKRPEM